MTIAFVNLQELKRYLLFILYKGEGQSFKIYCCQCVFDLQNKLKSVPVAHSVSEEIAEQYPTEQYFFFGIHGKQVCMFKAQHCVLV